MNIIPTKKVINALERSEQDKERFNKDRIRKELESGIIVDRVGKALGIVFILVIIGIFGLILFAIIKWAFMTVFVK